MAGRNPAAPGVIVPGPLYGERFATNPGHSTVLASGDFETYSEAGYLWHPETEKWGALQKGKPGIQSVGAWAYAAHPSTEVLVFRYDLKDGYGLRYWRPGEPNPAELFEHHARGLLFEACNSFFEFAVWACVCGPRYGWPPPKLETFRDVAAKAALWTLPRKLEKMANVLGTETRKDTRGALVMRKVSTPHSPTKNVTHQRYTRENSAEDFATLDDYCGTDVKTEDEASYRLADLSETETRIFLADQAINTRGVCCDREAVNACIKIIEKAGDRYNAELYDLTRGLVPSTTQIHKLKEWIAARGYFVESLDVEHVGLYLADPTLPPECRRALEIRKIMGSESVKKVYAMLRQMTPDNRIRGLYTYCGGARTRRWAGGGVQPQNLPNSGPPVVKCAGCNVVYWKDLEYCPRCFTTEAGPAGWGIEAAEACLPAILSGSLDIVESLWGEAYLAIAGCLRSLFIAGPGKELICSDFSAIEAVVLAEIAGEDWRREVFHTHGNIYEMSASKISGVDFEEFARYKSENGMNHPLRKKLGKVAELASGYQGWVGAWKQFGADEYMSEEEIKNNVIKWREESPAIVELWGELERSAINAVENPGGCYRFREVAYQTRSGVLYCQLPSGRAIPYHAPVVAPEVRHGRARKALSYMGINAITKKWERTEAYGGSLTENVCQATARDIFAAAVVRLEDAKYPVVLHTHDEPTSEVDIGYGSVEEFEKIMEVRDAWFASWPIRAAGGWRGKRYRKD